ncbi:MAG: hypothetical protein ACXWP5_15125 [Bdellovibrionota bacterium]
MWRFLSSFALFVLITGCNASLTRFGHHNKSQRNVTRAEVADSGSGNATNVIGSSGHSISRVTVGGYYLRRVGVASSSGDSLNAGLFGNPKATE